VDVERAAIRGRGQCLLKRGVGLPYTPLLKPSGPKIPYAAANRAWAKLVYV